MAIVVERKPLSLLERTYLPQIASGLWITLKNFFKPKVTLEYPDQRPVLATAAHRLSLKIPTGAKNAFHANYASSCARRKPSK